MHTKRPSALIPPISSCTHLPTLTERLQHIFTSRTLRTISNSQIYLFRTGRILSGILSAGSKGEKKTLKKSLSRLEHNPTYSSSQQQSVLAFALHTLNQIQNSQSTIYKAKINNNVSIEFNKIKPQNSRKHRFHLDNSHRLSDTRMGTNDKRHKRIL